MSRRRLSLLAAVPLIVGFFMGANASFAQQPPEPTEIQTEIRIPLSENVAGYSDGKVADVANYIDVIYRFVISIVGLVAAVMIIIGGFQYLTSAGDAGRIGAAKKRIMNALIGLVLAFSSFLLLSTINPNLLRFKPLSQQLSKDAIATQLSMLPWCEDVVAQGFAKGSVEPVIWNPSAENQGLMSCGSIGEYVLAASQDSKAFCVYRGNTCQTFEAQSQLSRRVTCMQRGHTTAEIRKIVDDATKAGSGASDFDTIAAAECITCAGLNPAWAAKVGYSGSISSLCSVWQKNANGGEFSTLSRQYVMQKFNTTIVSYCGYSWTNKSCVQSDIDCSTADENEDDAPGGPDHRAYEGALSTGDDPDCQGYDEGSRNISWYELATGKMKYAPDASLEDYPDHLYNVCVANPCNYNAPKGGCTPGSGIVKDIVHKLSSGSMKGVEDCNNKGRVNGTWDAIF